MKITKAGYPNYLDMILIFIISQGWRTKQLMHYLGGQTKGLCWLVELEFVLAIRHPDHNNHTSPQVLIKWKGLLEFEASWEPGELIIGQFPGFYLEDKVSLDPGVMLGRHRFVIHTLGGTGELTRGNKSCKFQLPVIG